MAMGAADDAIATAVAAVVSIGAIGYLDIMNMQILEYVYRHLVYLDFKN
jgi:hypothetical protein